MMFVASTLGGTDGRHLRRKSRASSAPDSYVNVEKSIAPSLLLGLDLDPFLSFVPFFSGGAAVVERFFAFFSVSFFRFLFFVFSFLAFFQGVAGVSEHIHMYTTMR